MFMRKRHETDAMSFVFSDLEEAVSKGRTMLPRFPRRWLCKYGDIRLEAPNVSREQREKLKTLKAEYQEMVKAASKVEISINRRDRYAGIPLHL